MRRRIVALVIAVFAFALFLVLGEGVGKDPDPGWLFFTEMQWVNHSTLVAWWLTWFGYVYVLAPICIALLVVAVRSPEWRWPIVASIAALLLAWQGADVFQHFFARPRRLDWVVKHETAFSYPSSHAAIATAFYLFWSILMARSALPFRAPLALALALLGFWVMWARLALGAHYITDIAGGILWGVTVVATLAAILPINIFQGRAGASLE
jgi:membrane-associated phospholipid phosphatase